MTLVLLKFTCNLSLFATFYGALILFSRPAIGADNKMILSTNNMIKILMSLIDTWLLYASVKNARLSISLKWRMGPCPTIVPPCPCPTIVPSAWPALHRSGVVSAWSAPWPHVPATAFVRMFRLVTKELKTCESLTLRSYCKLWGGRMFTLVLHWFCFVRQNSTHSLQSAQTLWRQSNASLVHGWNCSLRLPISFESFALLIYRSAH